MEEAGAAASGRGSSSPSDAKPVTQQEEAPREKALAVVKDFHRRIQGLEERLHDSERQRAALERQLVHNSGGVGGGAGGIGDGDGGGAGAALTVGLSAKLAAAAAGDTGELSMDAVAEAKKRYICRFGAIFFLLLFYIIATVLAAQRCSKAVKARIVVLMC